MAAYHIRFIEKPSDENDTRRQYIDQSSFAWLVTPCEPWRRPAGGSNVLKHNTYWRLRDDRTKSWIADRSG